MSWFLIGIGLTIFLFWFARFRGAIFGIGLTIFGGTLLLLSRFHLRKSMVLLGALFFTWVVIGIVSKTLQARKNK